MSSARRFASPDQLRRLIAASFVAVIVGTIVGTIVLLIVPFMGFSREVLFTSVYLSAQVGLPAIWLLAWPADVLTRHWSRRRRRWLMIGIGALAGAVWMLVLGVPEDWDGEGFSITSLFLLIYSVPPAAITAFATFSIVDRADSNKRLIYLMGPLCVLLIVVSAQIYPADWF